MFNNYLFQFLQLKIIDAMFANSLLVTDRIGRLIKNLFVFLFN